MLDEYSTTALTAAGLHQIMTEGQRRWFRMLGAGDEGKGNSYLNSTVLTVTFTISRYKSGSRSGKGT